MGQWLLWNNLKCGPNLAHHSVGHFLMAFLYLFLYCSNLFSSSTPSFNVIAPLNDGLLICEVEARNSSMANLVSEGDSGIKMGSWSKAVLIEEIEPPSSVGAPWCRASEIRSGLESIVTPSAP